jgi:hypothetical protein
MVAEFRVREKILILPIRTFEGRNHLRSVIKRRSSTLCYKHIDAGLNGMYMGYVLALYKGRMF